MKLHFVSRSYAVPLAYHALRQGCKPTAHMPQTPCGDGMFPIVPNAKPAGDCDAVIVDGAGWGKLVDELVKDGHRVLFGGAWAELMALKPDYNLAVLKKTGLPVAERGSQPYQLLVGGWYEDGFNPPYYAAVLRERLLAGDLGGYSGLVAAEVMPLESDVGSPLAMLDAVELALGGVQYRGLLSLSVVPMPDGLAATHIVAGVQPLIIEALSEMNRGGFVGLIDGKDTDSGTDCAVALSVSLPPWPYGLASPEPKVPVVIDDGQAKHFWPLDVCSEDGALRYAGAWGRIGAVTARGKPQTDVPGEHSWFDQAGYRARAMASRLGIEGLQYRNDVGYRSVQALDPLLGGV